MSIASQITTMQEHIEDIYDTFAVAGVDTSVAAKNIVNINANLKERLEYYLANGLDVVWNNWNKISGSGTTLSLNNTIQAKMDFVYKGNTSQESTTGKNLVNVQEQTVAGLTMQKQEDGSLLINGTISEMKFAQIIYMQPTSLPIDTYTLSCIDDSNKQYSGDAYVNTTYIYKNATNPKTFTTNEIGTSIRFNIYLPPKTYTNTKIYVQLESGSTATSYEPYTGGNPAPNPDYPYPVNVVTGDNEVKVVGKNLFNKNSGIKYGKFYTNTGDVGTDNDLFLQTIYIPVNSSTQYTISGSYTDYFRICEYDKDKNFIQRDLSDNTTTSFTITTTAQTKYVRVSCFNRNLSSIQIEQSSTATTYEPYQSQTYPINLGSMELCKIGDYQDYIYKEDGKWYKYGMIGKIVFDGSEEGWERSATATSGEYRFGISITNCKLGLDIPLKSNYFINTTQTTYSNRGIGGRSNAGGVFINDSFLCTLTLEQFETWASTHNILVYYPYATPTITEITDTTLIEQLEAIKLSYNEQTNISQTNTDKPFILDVTALKDLDAEDITPTLAINRGLSFTQPPVSENSINNEDDNSILEEIINEEEPNIEDDNREEEEPVDFFEKEIINNDEEQEEIPTEPIEIDNGQR